MANSLGLAVGVWKVWWAAWSIGSVMQTLGGAKHLPGRRRATQTYKVGTGSLWPCDPYRLGTRIEILDTARLARR